MPYVYLGKGGRWMFLPDRDEEEEREAVIGYRVEEREDHVLVCGLDDEPSEGLPGERVFVYGTLTDPVTVASVLGRVPKILYPAVLRGYCLALESVAGRYNTVVPEEDEVVKGALLLGLGREELSVIDRYEGYPALYDRRVEVVETPLGDVEAYVYVARAIAERSKG